MTAKPIIARERALGDIHAATDHYADEAGEAVALGFIDALESAYRLIAARPASGSLFHANALGIPGLRRWRLKRYPYLIFYLERDDHIDVWRVLHEQRDIPARMREPND